MIPIQYVHKSQMNTVKACSQQLYYKDILKLDSEFENESSLAGRSFHKFAEEIYRSTKPDKWTDAKYWVQFWIDDFQNEKKRVLAEGKELNQVEDIKSEEYAQMIIEFLKQSYNRYAEPVLLEAPFRFGIKDGRKIYWFEGRIDQLLKIQTADLQHIRIFFKDTKDMDYFNSHRTVYIHRDIKSGNKKIMSEISLTTDDNINVYAYALAFGLFDLNGSGVYNKSIHHIPFMHALYYTRDHLTYKKNYGEHKVGDPRGQAMYFVKKTYDDLKKMERELINLHKKINSGIYTRDGAGSNLCDSYCGFKHICLHDWHTNG